MRFFLELSYKGTKYNGWQRQNNAPSIQQTIEDALSKLLREPILIVGAGRTDSGVHASCYVAHFDTQTTSELSDNFTYHLNAILPEDIAIQKIYPVSTESHARFNAISREYKYYVKSHKDPFSKELSWQYYVQLDINKMNEAAKYLLIHNDFTTFGKLHSNNKTNICHITKAEWCIEEEYMVFTIRADRFLRNMVRAIVGTLVDVGRGRMSVEMFEQIIIAKDLKLCGSSAPAQGLFLSDIVYPNEIYITKNL